MLNNRALFEEKHPTPNGVSWNAIANRYVGAPGRVSDGDRHQTLWEGWRSALEAFGHLLEPQIEDDSQSWAGMPGHVAFSLIERHMDNWPDALKMMNEWLAATSPCRYTNTEAERVRFIEAMQGEAELQWNTSAGRFLSTASQKLWMTWQRSASINRQHWLPYPDTKPNLCGHYDAFVPGWGRYADAYYENGQWATEYEGDPIQGVTHYQSCYITPDDLTSDTENPA